MMRTTMPVPATSFERAMQLVPARGDSLIMLAETRAKQNRVADAIPLYQKAIAAEIAAGRKPEKTGTSARSRCL